MPLELEEYVHRIGRTGRAGAKGVAYSFFDPKKDSSVAKDLCSILEKSGASIPQELENLKFSSSGKKGRGNQRGHNRWSGGGGGGGGGPRVGQKRPMGN